MQCLGETWPLVYDGGGTASEWERGEYRWLLPGLCEGVIYIENSGAIPGSSSGAEGQEASVRDEQGGLCITFIQKK